jgi:hypothetical protein
LLTFIFSDRDFSIGYGAFKQKILSHPAALPPGPQMGRIRVPQSKHYSSTSGFRKANDSENAGCSPAARKPAFGSPQIPAGLAVFHQGTRAGRIWVEAQLFAIARHQMGVL